MALLRRLTSRLVALADDWAPPGRPPVELTATAAGATDALARSTTPGMSSALTVTSWADAVPPNGEAATAGAAVTAAVIAPAPVPRPTATAASTNLPRRRCDLVGPGRPDPAREDRGLCAADIVGLLFLYLTRGEQ
jgi:hypothetical protein